MTTTFDDNTLTNIDEDEQIATTSSTDQPAFGAWVHDLQSRGLQWLVALPLAAWATFAIVAISTATVLWTALEGGFLLADTTPTGGDMGAHVWAPAFLRDELLPNFRITGWAPAWYAGFPAFHFYMILPSLFIVMVNVGLHWAAALVGTAVLLAFIVRAWYLDQRPRVVSVLAAFAIVLLWPVPYGISFKLIVVSGLVTLPLAGYLFGRLAGLAFPLPAIFSVATLLFAYDNSFNIYGGNWASTMAGEFAFSIALSFCLVYLGLLARGLDSGRGRVLASVFLALTGLSHLIVALFAMAFTFIYVLVRPNWRTIVRFLLPAGLVAGLLSAFWTLPFVGRSAYLNDMGWSKLLLFKSYLWDRSTLNPDFLVDWPPLELVVVAAIVGFILSIVRRNRVGVALGLTALTIALGFIHLPETRLWNGRILPFYYLSLYLLASIGLVECCRTVFRQIGSFIVVPSESANIGATVTDGDGLSATEVDDSDGAPTRLRSLSVDGIAAGSTALVVFLVLWTLVLLPLRPNIPVLSHTAGDGTYELGPLENRQRSFIPGWVRWNFSGYENKPNSSSDGDYAEYNAIISTMAGIGAERGCGRSLWEFDSELNRYGTTMAMMLLPHWTDGCVGSMEGLYFEASATTPFHFLMQSELSKSPSQAQRTDTWGEVAYPPFSIDEGVDHLQLMGVKYYLAFSDEALAAARSHEELEEVGASYPWVIFEVADAEIVQPLEFEPVVYDDVSDGHKSWLEPAVRYFLSAPDQQLFFAVDGPDAWQRISARETVDGSEEIRLDFAAAAEPRRLPDVSVSNIVETTDTISFDVSEIGSPVLVKTSYFPNWTVEGADGPYRVTPNLMVVVPTQDNVTLTYKTTPLEYFAYALTLLGVVLACAMYSLRNVLFGDDSASAPAPAFEWVTIVVAALVVIFVRLVLAVAGVGPGLGSVHGLVWMLGGFAVVSLALVSDWTGWWDGRGKAGTDAVIGGAALGVAVAIGARVVSGYGATPGDAFFARMNDSFLAISLHGRVSTAILGAVGGAVLGAATLFALGASSTSNDPGSDFDLSPPEPAVHGDRAAEVVDEDRSVEEPARATEGS